MMNEIEYLLAAILVMAISTYLTRLTPFLMFTPGKENAVAQFCCKKYSTYGHDDSCHLYVERG